MNQVLHVRVAEPESEARARLMAHARAIDAGIAVEPLIEIGFAQAGEMLAVFTPKRWELIGELRRSGPLTIYALARRLKREYKNVHVDVQALADWLMVEKDEAGRVFVPYAEIVMDMRLPGQVAT